ncbi:MFS transporter [Rothia nasimurium]|uniref:MFS transporter n=1 Tax=Rothia nasimurium TaxID=85336 RepID=UPI00162ABEB2|nr:MFS transporter [Rothia nasimurium]
MHTSSSAGRVSAVWVYLSSAALSMLGNSIAGIVWPWLVLERTGNPAAAGIVAAAIAVPSLVFAYFGGNLVDSLGRKPVSVISDIISGLSVVAVIAVDMVFGLTLSWFIIIGILGAVGDIPGMSARAALVGDVAATSGKKVAQISGWNQALSGVSFLVGPAVAGVLMTALPIEQVLWITAACSLLAAALTASLRLQKAGVGVRNEGQDAPAQPGEDGQADAPASSPEIPAGDPFKGFAGWKKALSYPVIRLLALDSLLSMALVMPYLMVLLPAHFQGINQPGLYGASMSAFAVGMMVTSIVAGKIIPFPRRAWVVGMVFYTLAFFGMALLETSWLAIVGLGISGLGGGIMNPLQTLLVTEGVPEQIRGRSFSIFMAISQVAGPIGLVATSAVLAFVTIYQVAWVLAGLWLLVAIYLVVRGLQLLPARSAESVEKGAPAPVAE